MKYLLFITILLIALLYTTDAQAGVIFRPVFHTGLVGYWDFQEGAGSIANDHSGYDNHGTLENMATSSNGGWTDGKLGSALDFDGDDDYVESENNIGISGSQAHTISMWIKPGDSDDDGQLLYNSGNASNGQLTSIFYNMHSGVDDGADEGIYFAGWGGDYDVDGSANTITRNAWNHVAVTHENDIISIYVNGELDISEAINTLAIADTTAKIGKAVSSWQYFEGTIDEVRIYNRALSAGEIERLYKLSQPKIAAPTETGLVGYWRFDEGTGTKAGDHSGNGNNGDLTNMEEADWVDGKLGGAVDLDGSNEYVRVTDIDATDGITKMTVSAWAKPADVTNDYMAVVYKFSFTGGNNGWFMATGGVYGGSGPDDILVGVTDADNDICYTTANFLANDTWGHWTMVYDGDGATNTDKLKFYFNGVQQSLACNGTILSTTPITDHVVTIGTSDDEGNRFFEGNIDEVRIYNRALEANEIETLYKSGLAKINASQNDKITDGLVGLWSFNGPDMDGNEAWDRSGEGNHGTLVGDPIRTSGKVGQALEFDGDDDYVEINDGRISNATQGTISVWVYVNELEDGAKMVAYGGGSAGNAGAFTFDIRLDTNYYFSIVQRSDGGNWSGIRGNTQLSNNTWYHVVLTSDGTSWSIYVNGQKESLSSLPFDSDGNNGDWFGDTICAETDKTSIGNIMYDGSYTGTYFNGIIDEVRIYNRALSAEEIQRLYNM